MSIGPPHQQRGDEHDRLRRPRFADLDLGGLPCERGMLDRQYAEAAVAAAVLRMPIRRGIVGSSVRSMRPGPTIVKHGGP